MMVPRLSQAMNVKVLLSNADWAWPEAVSKIFQPRGINALVANSSSEMVRIIDNNRIHLAILDLQFDDRSGLQTLKIVRKHNQLIPFILLTHQTDDRILAEALTLDAFSVLAKPVDLALLAGKINRVFQKYYASDMFSGGLR